ncbi:PREDICTED: ribonuclease UK114-like [Amphimedon queenslandica]|uniref:Uncharacterized protein n=1 Tax=Amphimedon queenslandica TaxID=400682 RepID=A0A1X7UCT0_AMPQE|nr:PREDICTED: ribonuclease UK114-like [Amphimedon queenslandica]|eukprot:XP_019855031.1 PREDICTED: ribonuclease UK114-like [Amphimedon queenslandica]
MAASQVVRRIICCDKIAKPVGPYNHAVIVNGTVYVAGMIGMNKDGQLVDGGVKAQAEQTLENIKAVLETAGCTCNNVVKTTVLLADIKDYATVNSVYTNYFPPQYAPARAAYQVATLPKNALVEIEAVAVLGDIVDQ